MTSAELLKMMDATPAAVPRLHTVTEDPADVPFTEEWMERTRDLHHEALELLTQLRQNGVDQETRDRAEWLRLTAYTLRMEAEGRIVAIDKAGRPYPFQQDEAKTRGICNLEKKLRDITQSRDLAYYAAELPRVVDGLRDSLSNFAKTFGIPTRPEGEIVPAAHVAPDPNRKPKGNWSAPMTKAEAARRITKSSSDRGRKIEPLLTEWGYQKVSPKKIQICLDNVPENLRRRIEAPDV